MNNRVNLHPSYERAWAVWLALFLADLTFKPGIWWTRGIFSAFLILEGIGFLRRKPLGDTLSEFMQKIASWAPENVLWYRSWKVLPVGLCILIAYRAAWMLSYDGGPWVDWPLGVIAGPTILMWNAYHWAKREKYG